MKITKRAQRDARQLFRSCRVNGVLDESRVRQTVSLLLAQKPRGYVGILSRLYRAGETGSGTTRRARGKCDAVVRRFADGCVKSDQEIYGVGADIAFGQDPALIGGLRIQVGSDLYDGTVRTRLEKLEQSFLTEFYE